MLPQLRTEQHGDSPHANLLVRAPTGSLPLPGGISKVASHQRRSRATPLTGHGPPAPLRPVMRPAAIRWMMHSCGQVRPHRQESEAE